MTAKEKPKSHEEEAADYLASLDPKSPRGLELVRRELSRPIWGYADVFYPKK